jgi:uridine phosphorylase
LNDLNNPFSLFIDLYLSFHLIIPEYKFLSFPILEFDPSPNAIIEPHMVQKPADISEYCVITFFADVISKVIKEYNARVVSIQLSEIGEHPVYEFEYEGKKINIVHPGVGGPLTVGLLEEVIALGCKKFIVCGGCGVLQESIERGHLLVPVAAVRDEGVSYHYMPPSREVQANLSALEAIKSTLDNEGYEYTLTKTWTTDAIYRETEKRAAQRMTEGCLCVEMEAASLMAAAQFRNVTLGQILYAGDVVHKDKWDHRGWNKIPLAREPLFWLAVKACLKL